MRRSVVVVMSLFAIAGGLPLAAEANDREICFTATPGQGTGRLEGRIAACKRLIASGTLAQTTLERVQKWVGEVEPLLIQQRNLQTVFYGLLDARGAEFLRDHIRKKVCEPVMRDVFAGQSREKFEGVMRVRCEDCFIQGLDADFSKEELHVWYEVITGNSKDVNVRARKEVEKKYDGLFRSCSTKLVEGLGEELNSEAQPGTQDRSAETKPSALIKAGKDEKVCSVEFRRTGETRRWVCKKEEPCCVWHDTNDVKCGSTTTGCL